MNLCSFCCWIRKWFICQPRFFFLSVTQKQSANFKKYSTWSILISRFQRYFSSPYLIMWVLPKSSKNWTNWAHRGAYIISNGNNFHDSSIRRPQTDANTQYEGEEDGSCERRRLLQGVTECSLKNVKQPQRQERLRQHGEWGGWTQTTSKWQNMTAHTQLPLRDTKLRARASVWLPMKPELSIFKHRFPRKARRVSGVAYLAALIMPTEWELRGQTSVLQHS